MPDQPDGTANDEPNPKRAEDGGEEPLSGPLCKITRPPNATGTNEENTPADGAYVRETGTMDDTRDTITRYSDVERVSVRNNHTVVVKRTDGSTGVHQHVQAFGAGANVTVEYESPTARNVATEEL